MARKWYAVSVLSNFENKIADQIKKAVTEQGLQDEIDEILVPTEPTLVVRRGKRVEEGAAHHAGLHPRAHGDVAPGPAPDRLHQPRDRVSRRQVAGSMRDEEVNAILSRVQDGEERPRPTITFDVGELVKVRDGPFEDFDGMVVGVDDERQRLRVNVSIFGRETPVELEFTRSSSRAEVM